MKTLLRTALIILAIAAVAVAKTNPNLVDATVDAITAKLNAATADATADATNLPTGDTGTLLASLTVADEHTDGYDRATWAHWTDPDGNGCDARVDTLRRDGHNVQVDPTGRCAVLAGDWVDPYTGVENTDPTNLDIDHIVALQETHQSGGWAWTPAEKERYANDLSVLVASDASANRSKSDLDPAEWASATQIDPARLCWLASEWVEVKAAYGLTVDPAERDGLATILTGCGS